MTNKVAGIKDGRIHFKEATKQLKQLIDTGIIDKSKFSEKQLQDISHCRAEITGFSWHHHEDMGRMQLVPRKVHKEVGHIGGFDLWFK